MLLLIKINLHKTYYGAINIMFKQERRENMKKIARLTFVVFSSFLCLTSCTPNNDGSSNSSSNNSTSISNNDDIVALVNNLQQSFALKGNFVWETIDYDNEEIMEPVSYINNVYMDEDEYYLYQESNETNLVTKNWHYFKNPLTRNIAHYQRNHLNEVNLVDISDEQGITFIYDDFYLNPFTCFDSNDFIKIDDNTFSLDIENVESTAIIPAMLFYYSNDYPFEVRKLNIITDDNNNPISMSLETFGLRFEVNYDFYAVIKYEATFTNREELDNINKVPYEIDDDISGYTTFVDRLKEHNYTVTIHDTDKENSEIYTDYKAIITKEGVALSISGTREEINKESAFITIENEGVVEVDTSDTNNLIGLTLPIPSVDLSYYMCDFSYSYAFIEKNADNQYILKKDAPSDVVYLLPDARYNENSDAIDLSSLKFTINNNEMSYTYNYQNNEWNNSTGGTITVTVSDVNTSIFPFNKANYRAKNVPTSWQEVITSVGGDYDKFCATFGQDLNTIVPFYYPEVGYIDFTWTSNYCWLDTADFVISSDIDRFQEEFIELLEANGYVLEFLKNPQNGDLTYKHIETGALITFSNIRYYEDTDVGFYPANSPYIYA